MRQEPGGLPWQGDGSEFPPTWAEAQESLAELNRRAHGSSWFLDIGLG